MNRLSQLFPIFRRGFFNFPVGCVLKGDFVKWNQPNTFCLVECVYKSNRISKYLTNQTDVECRDKVLTHFKEMTSELDPEFAKVFRNVQIRDGWNELKEIKVLLDTNQMDSSLKKGEKKLIDTKTLKPNIKLKNTAMRNQREEVKKNRLLNICTMARYYFESESTVLFTMYTNVPRFISELKTEEFDLLTSTLIFVDGELCAEIYQLHKSEFPKGETMPAWFKEAKDKNEEVPVVTSVTIMPYNICSKLNYLYRCYLVMKTYFPR